jgi:hypothetical protein
MTIETDQCAETANMKEDSEYIDSEEEEEQEREEEEMEMRARWWQFVMAQAVRMYGGPSLRFEMEDDEASGEEEEEAEAEAEADEKVLAWHFVMGQVVRAT